MSHLTRKFAATVAVLTGLIVGSTVIFVPPAFAHEFFTRAGVWR